MIDARAREASILIVEDSDVQALELRLVLERNGYAVSRAASAEAALDLLNQNVPDLIVADYQLPNMDGRELTRQLRLNERTRAVPIVLMTSDKRVGEHAGLESGADVYVPKSRDPQPLLLRVSALLRGRRHNRQDPGAQFRQGQILILDSSTTKRLQLQDLLQKEGYRIELADTPEQADAALERDHADCVVVSLLDARFDGLEACRHLARRRDARAAGDNARQPFLIVAVGGARNATDDLLKSAFEAGVDDVVLSSSDTELLRLRLRALVRRQLMMDEAARLDDERTSAQRTLEQLRVLVDGVTDYALYMLDPEGKVSTWNPGAERIKGYKAEEIVGHHVSDFYTPEERASGEAERALKIAREEGRYETEAQRVRKDGSRFWAHVIIDSIHGENGKLRGYAKVTRDVTEIRAAQEELQTARAALMHAQKMEAIGQLTGGIAHDFNNLLMAVLGNLELLQKHTAGDDRADRLVDGALQGARRGAALTQRLLAFARRQSLETAATDLGELVSGMRDLMMRSLGPEIELKLDAAQELPPVLIDRNQVELALLNLVVNARDAMPDGGNVVVATRMACEAAAEDLQAGEYVVLSVRDSGSGMDEDTLKRAIEPFFSTKELGKGTGLGLSMIHGLANQLHGTLRLSSTQGVGTVAEMFLPITRLPLAEPSQPEAVTPVEARPSRILLVDDDVLISMSTADMLQDLGHEVFEANSGAEALALINGGQAIDMVVTDFAMPGMSGVQLAGKIREILPNVPILLATGYAELPHGEKIELPRISKPYSQAQLAKEVTKLLSDGKS